MDLHPKSIVTLVSSRQAKVGNVFIHKGSASKCDGCDFSRVCVKNLEPGRVYSIIKVRGKNLHCKHYETQMQVVEAIEAEIPTAVPSKQAILGAVITLQTAICKKEECEGYELCFPVGLKDGDKCEILDVTGSLECSGQVALKRVVLRRVPAF